MLGCNTIDDMQLDLWPDEAPVVQPADLRPKHLMLTDTVRALTPDGEHEKLTKVFRKVVNSTSPKRRQRQLRFARRFMKFAMNPGEDCLTFLADDLETAIERIEGALDSVGLDVDHDNNDLLLGTCWVAATDRSLSISYLSEYVYVIRKLYRELARAKLRERASPADVDNWHAMTPAQRRKFARDMFPDNQYAWRNAGGRFIVRQNKRGLPFKGNPGGCADRMYDSLVERDVPQEVLDIDLIAKVNGNRIMEGAELSGLGLAMKEFSGEEVMARNKKSGPNPVKTLTIPSEVGGRIMRRLTDAPHPNRPDASLLDHMKELWTAGKREALKAIPLIPSARTGRAYGYSGLHYHMYDAWEGRVLVHSPYGVRSATSHFNRHAAIFSDVVRAMDDDPDDDTFDDRMRTISATYSQKTDQTNQYAAAAKEQRIEQIRVRNLRRREEEAEARRNGEPWRAAEAAFDDDELEAEWQGLPA